MKKINKKLKILSITEGLNPTYFIRHFEPLSYLEKNEQIELTTKYDTQIFLSDLLKNDVFILNRTRNDLMTKFIQFANLHNKKIIYDIDDYILKIPSYSKDILTEQQKSNILYALTFSHKITVSTLHLKKILSVFRKDITIIPNSINFNKYGAYNKRLNDLLGVNNFNIVISLSDNFPLYKANLKKFTELLSRIINKYPNVKIYNFSNIIIDEDNNSIINKGLMDYSAHKLFLKEHPIHLALNPIEIINNNKEKFINSKSEIKFIEYSSAKILGIYSNSPIYNSVINNNKTGILLNNNFELWENKISLIIKNYQKYWHMVEAAFKFTKNNYDVKNSANLLNKVIQNINKNQIMLGNDAVKIKSQYLETLELNNSILCYFIEYNRLGRLIKNIIQTVNKFKIIRYLIKTIFK
jgi:hypothetical protein